MCVCTCLRHSQPRGHLRNVFSASDLKNLMISWTMQELQQPLVGLSHRQSHLAQLATVPTESTQNQILVVPSPPLQLALVTASPAACMAALVPRETLVVHLPLAPNQQAMSD